jgi:hypothetical protein
MLRSRNAIHRMALRRHTISAMIWGKRNGFLA